MIGFYQSAIPHCQYLLSIFRECKGPDAHKLVNSLMFESSFAVLKHALLSATALARPDFMKPFYYDVDTATVNGVGAALSQRDDENDPASHKPIAFWSTRLGDSERGWPVRDQECFGLVEGLLHWRHYLLGAKVIARCDHESLQWLMTTKHRDGSRVQDWALRVHAYDLTIQYGPGSKHVTADFLSRLRAPIDATDALAASCLTDCACAPVSPSVSSTRVRGAHLRCNRQTSIASL